MSSSLSTSSISWKVKLRCPLVSKIVSLVAWEEQRLDLGYIARAFGLDPSTLKLNGHYVSRGKDLVSSSVTWRSLLNFFSARGLSTGKDDNDALVVDGKLSKPGTKRGPEPKDVESRIQRIEPEDGIVNRRPQDEDRSSLANKKLKENKSVCKNGLGFKRKLLLEDFSLLKKLNEANSDSAASHSPSITPSKQFTCSYLSGSMKRIREDELGLAAPCKRIR